MFFIFLLDITEYSGKYYLRFHRGTKYTALVNPGNFRIFELFFSLIDSIISFRISGRLPIIVPGIISRKNT